MDNNQQLIKLQFNTSDVSDSTEEAKGLVELEVITDSMTTVDDSLVEIESELTGLSTEINTSQIRQQNLTILRLLQVVLKFSVKRKLMKNTMHF